MEHKVYQASPYQLKMVFSDINWYNRNDTESWDWIKKQKHKGVKHSKE